MEAVVVSGNPETEAVRKQDEKDLADVHLLTEMIREHQRQIITLGKKRREKINRLRSNRITFREIAEAMGITEQAVFKIIQGGGNKSDA